VTSSTPPPVPRSIPPIVPYASPAGIAPTGGAYRQGKILVAYKGATLPTNCVKCNAPADKPPIERKFAWHPPGYYFFLLLSIWPYILAALITQKRGEVYITVCKKHRTKRAKTLLIAWVGAAIGAAVLIAGFASVATNSHDPLIWTIPAGFLLLIASAVYGILAGRYLTAKRIDAHYLYLKGACDEFLNGLPGVANQP
jgi:hypothetical protein